MQPHRTGDSTGPVPTTDPFRFEYAPGTLRYGPDCVADLGTELDRMGIDRALVVCGRTVGSTPAVIDPVREGLGDRLAGVFDRTTPEKRIDTALAAADRIDETGAGAVVGLGGGSSIDTAKVAAALAAADRSREASLESFVESGTVVVPESGVVPVVAVPTTLTGADLSRMAGITAGPETHPTVDGVVHGGAGGAALMPALLAYDPELFRTTPDDVLCASAMNGFDKAVETLYAPTRTPVTDATAVRALELLSTGLPALGTGDRDPETTRAAVLGTVLAQYGVSRPDGTTLSLIHAFGHALSRPYDLQQGAAHGVVAPHVLEFLFDRAGDDPVGVPDPRGDGSTPPDPDRPATGPGLVAAGRDRIAAGLGVDAGDSTPEEVATGVVEAVTDLRDALGLPDRLRDVEGVDRGDLPAVAGSVLADGLTPNSPIEPSREDVEGILRAAW